MLGMPGMRVLEPGEVDGQLEVTIETVDAVGWCPGVWGEGEVEGPSRHAGT